MSFFRFESRVVFAGAMIVLVSVNASVIRASDVLPTQESERVHAAPHREEPVQVVRPFKLLDARSDLTTLSVDRAALRHAATTSRVDLRSLPVTPGKRVDLRLKPFSVITPDTKFVIGRKNGPDLPLRYEPTSLSMFHGTVAGDPGSHVFLAVGDREATGYIQTLGTVYRLSNRGRDGQRLPDGRLSVFRALQSEPSLPPGVAACGVAGEDVPRGERDLRVTPKASPARSVPGTDAPRVSLRHLELAVETDFEYFELFNDVTAATDYIVAMYGEVSAIYMRDLDTRVEVVFARIWDEPDDLFNVVEPSPLPEFAAYWNANMGAVERDAAQLFSGRRDYPFGGQAYVSALCNSFAYGVVGYAVGAFPDPSMPSPLHYDITVTAHELGHNAGTGHTHDDGIDTCQDPDTTPQRGTIMSYCGQTWSGGNANRDLRFHTLIQSNIESYISTVSCVPADCNANGTADSTDIFDGSSDDANSNGVPDECEDCNDNGVLDPADISGGMPDLNANGIPDGCEPDCNGNGVPDDRDILLGTSTDAYGDGVPDECEADCNGNGISDYTDIQLDMPLDVDRDTVIDSCQDCDSDGTTDIDALGGAHSLWIASGINGTPIREFYADTGVLTRASSGAGSLLGGGQDLIVTGDGRVLATDELGNRVAEYTLDGTYVGDLVSAADGGLSDPAGLVMAPSGDLLVSSRGTDSVLRFDGTTGAPLGAFVTSGSGGLTSPFGVTFGPGGNLFVTSAANEVIEYDGSTGALVGVFVSAMDNGGLTSPRGLTFKGDGNLLVASFGTNEVLEFDGATGGALGKWAQVGTATRLTQVSPWGIRVGPNGNVFVVRTGEDFGSGGGSGQYDAGETDVVNVPTLGGLHLTNAQIYEFDVRNGNFIRAHVNGNDHALFFPTGFDFVPGWTIDCNLNLLPDNCDIASGFSLDVDASGVPDECEVDCNGNGNLDRTDIIPFGSSLDCNSNLLPDECDLSSGASPDCNSNGVPDECEADCNGNGVPDDCDVTSGSSTDCDGDGVLDECDPDCNDNGTSDVCEIESGSSDDCNGNAVPDGCEADCNANGVADECDLATGSSNDCNGNAAPDECELDATPVEYTIGLSGLFGLSGDCGGGSLFSCDDPFGFEWQDTLAGSVAQVTIEFNLGVDCHAGGTIVPGSLNGGSIETFATNSTFCQCGATSGFLASVTPDPGDYVVGGLNRWEITAPECLGFIPSAELGGAYARVTVTPVSDTDGSGLPDDCDLDCNNNGVSDAIDISEGTSADCNNNGVPDECDIAGGKSQDQNGDGVPDECGFVFPDPLIDATGEARNNRYLMFEAPAAVAGVATSYVRVRIIELDGFAVPDQELLYVGPPMQAPDENVSQPGLTFAVAPLQCALFEHDWTQEGVVSVYGAEIVPNSTYKLQHAFGVNCPLSNDACWSDPITITTAEYGDLVAPFADSGFPQPDFGDISAMVGKFLAEADAPPKAVAQLQPNVVFPERAIDFNDIAADVEAFLGTPYAAMQPGPCVCPSTVACEAKACGSNEDCAPGLCIENFCRDACARCSP